jgi:hypothetical protein
MTKCSTSCSILLSHQPKSHTPQTNSHLTPELSICAPGDLTMSNFAHTAAFLNASVQLPLASMKISFVSLFYRLGGRFSCVRLHFEYFTFSTPLRDQLSRLFPLYVAHRISDLKILWNIPFLPVTKGFLNGPWQ